MVEQTTKSPRSEEEVRATVREHYGRLAVRKAPSGCCGPSPQDDAAAGCGCGSGGTEAYSLGLGYSEADLADLPEGADLGLGCGNPTALAELRPGEVVLDLGAGAGIDAFIAAQRVGPEGRVIGVDMTREMLARARKNAVEAGLHDRVEFREGLIEELPVANASVDVVISNCVINLSPDKGRVFREAFRVLKPGGRLAVSDICLSAPLPPAIAGMAAALSACVGGALLAEDYLGAITAAGFDDVAWTRTAAGAIVEDALGYPEMAPAIALLGAERIGEIGRTVWSYRITARRP